jgi:hypothetical protein
MHLKVELAGDAPTHMRVHTHTHTHAAYVLISLLFVFLRKENMLRKNPKIV